MGKQVKIKFLGRDDLVGSLCSAFSPESGKIEIIPRGQENQLAYSLDDICCIYFEGKSVHGTGKDAKVTNVEVVSGDIVRVIIPEQELHSSGFFAFFLYPEPPFGEIFFTAAGVRLANKLQFIGEILVDKGIISGDALSDVLAEQERLKSRRLGDILVEENNVSQELLESTLSQSTRQTASSPPLRVGDLLVEAGLVTREQVEMALASQTAGRKKRVGELLIEKGYITEDQLLQALSVKFNLPFIDLGRIVPSEEAINSLPLDLVSRLQVFPVEFKNNTLVVATSHPTDPTIGDTLRFYTNHPVKFQVARSKQISQAIERYYAKPDSQIGRLIDDLSQKIDYVEEVIEDSSLSESDSQIINLVSKILLDGFKKGASDIHFEPGPGKQPMNIRYRIDGICSLVHQIEGAYKNAVTARLKIISTLNIAEHRKPQSGKIKMNFGKQLVEYRIEITPTVGSMEDAVLRILAGSKPLPLESMGFAPQILHDFMEVLQKPYGLILCVGPTGSGKTTTLHSALGHLNSPERKIWTAEDPVEITQAGLRQVQVNAAIGFTFQEALRSFLRADPDIIMVGEMRDRETAKIAIEASLTGHLVLSTLHTNSAPETVARLLDMDIDAINFAEALLGVIAQRLARRLCSACKVSYHPDLEEYQQLQSAYGEEWWQRHNLPPYSVDLQLQRKGGCDICGNCGYKGRVAIHEFLVATPAIKKAIKNGIRAEELLDLSMSEGLRTLRMDGIYKIMQGETDLEQVLRVCR